MAAPAARERGGAAGRSLMSRLARNVLWNLGGQAALMLLGLLAVRFVFRQLGADVFGLILFAQTAAVVLVGVFDFGISATVTRELAASAAADRHYVRDLLRTASLIYWVGYLVLVAALIGAAPMLVRHWINLQSIDPVVATRMVQILGCGALLALPRSLYASLFRGLQEMAFNNLIEAGALAVQQVGIIGILLLSSPRPTPVEIEREVVAVALWFSGSYLLGVLAYVAVACRHVPGVALIPGYSAAALRRNLRYSAHMMSNSALAMVHSQSDKVLVSKLLPIGTLGTYGFAAALVAGVGRVTASVMQAAFPAFSDMDARLDRGGLMRQYRNVHHLVVVGTAPLFAGLLFAGQPVLSYVFNPGIGRALMPPLALLTLGWYMNATLSAPYIVSLAVGRPQIAARQNFLALFVVLPVAAVLVYILGTIGAAASWIVYHLFAYAYGLPRICRECLQLELAAWFRHIGTAMAVIILTYGIAYALTARGNLLTLAAAYLAATAAYLAISWRIAPADIRHAIRRFPWDRSRRLEAA